MFAVSVEASDKLLIAFLLSYSFSFAKLEPLYSSLTPIYFGFVYCFNHKKSNSLKRYRHSQCSFDIFQRSQHLRSRRDQSRVGVMYFFRDYTAIMGRNSSMYIFAR